MIGSLLGILIVGFLAFTLGGGLILRVAGMIFMLAAALEVLWGHNTSLEILGAIFGFGVWLVGHHAYRVYYGEYRSPVAEYFLGLLRFPELELTRRIYAAQYHLVHLRQDRREARRERQGAVLATLPSELPPSPDPAAIRTEIERAGDAAADTLRPRVEAKLEELHGVDWLQALNKHRAKSHTFPVPDLADPRVVLHTMAYNPAFRDEYVRDAAKQLLELVNAAHHRRALPDYEQRRAWDRALELGANRQSGLDGDAAGRG
jgi:hypothetical protein